MAGIFPGGILLDGFVIGIWKIHRERGPTPLRISPFDPLTDENAAALHEEGEQLPAFAAADTGKQATAITSQV